MDTMIPWLHFTAGDNLLFEAWNPSSKGAIAGACVGLCLFAVFERWINGVRGLLEAHWKKQASAAMSLSTSQGACHPSDLPPQSLSNRSDLKSEESDDVVEVAIKPLPSHAIRPQRTSRTVPPFIPSHDIPRGALFAFQSLLFYALMLAVMTFQAGYLVSIVVGLAIGEIMFGRYGSTSHPGH